MVVELVFLGRLTSLSGCPVITAQFKPGCGLLR